MISKDIGVYTIGLKDLSFSQAIEWAQVNSIPFLQVRGGRRGYDLLSASYNQINDWKKQIEEANIRIQAITTDIEIADLLLQRRSALEYLEQFNNIARLLGAGALRIMAQDHYPEILTHSSFIRNYRGVCLAIELHARPWFEMKELKKLKQVVNENNNNENNNNENNNNENNNNENNNIENNNIEVLLDIEQFLRYSGDKKDEKIDMILDMARIVHCYYSAKKYNEQLFHHLIDKIKQRPKTFEVCLEWYGKDSSSHECLKQYLFLCIKRFNEDKLNK